MTAATEFPNLLPSGESGWIYYLVCAVFFTVMGLACGYFIWRKGHMQMQDAEMQVKLAEQGLNELKKDLSLEEKEISLDGEEVGAANSSESG